MLVQLTIQNLVLMERLTLELSSGFNVITGETGAGKSMLVDALGLVIGGRASPDLVRRGAKEAEVEALFEVEPGSRVAAKLEAAGIPCEGELVLRRVVQLEGRSRAFANGRMCTVGQLAELAGDLCDIASQHESVALTDPATHLDTLDSFGGLEGAKAELGVAVDALSELAKRIEALRSADKTRAEREEFLGFQLRELEELDVQPGEELLLENERARLKHAGKLATSSDGSRRSSRRPRSSIRRSGRSFAPWKGRGPSWQMPGGRSLGTPRRWRATRRASPKWRTGCFASRSS
jgi:DNA repair protein RecN (Recombination protein N)